MRNLKMRFSYLSCQNIVSSLYLFVVLGFLPLFYKYQYADMGDAKYNIFLRSSILYVLILFLFLFFQFIWKIKKEGIQKWKETLKLDFSLLDQMVLLYFGCITISFLLCQSSICLLRKLAVIQLLIMSSLGEQFLMSSLFYNITFIYN